jgi:lipopolysaccharide transport system permease protein
MTILAESFLELNLHRDLLRTWTSREIRIRYKQSLLGGLWAVLQPLSVAIIFSVVFSFFVKVPTDGVPYLIFYYAALFPWAFFASAVTTGSRSLVANLNLVTKIYFPREILPLSGVLAALFDFVIAFVLYVVLALFYRIPVGPSIIVLPLLVALQLLFTIPVVLVLAALNVFYRDIRFVVPLALQVYMYSTPLIYPISTIPERMVPFYMLNPMASLIHAYRSILVYGQWPEPLYLVSAFLVSGVFLVASYAYFGKAARSFADLI